MIDDIIIALTTIGNCCKVKKICEENVSEPMELKAWMVERTLISLGLFENELKRQHEEDNGNK